MKVDYIEETSVRKALAFEVDKELVQAEIDRRAKDLAKKARLPGFRPGKTPPDVVKRRFRSEIFSETAEALVNKVVFEELEGRGLKPLAAPQVEGLKIEEGQPMTFRAVFARRFHRFAMVEPFRRIWEVALRLLLQFKKLESLILAQNERWRRA